MNKTKHSMRISAAVMVGSALLLTGSAAAQYNSNKVSFYAQIDLSTFGSNGGNDCWGYVSPSGREYALMGLNNKVAFVDISDPANPDWFASINHSSSTWGDIKVYQDVAYIVTEENTGIQVIDMADIDNHNISLVRTINSPPRSHNIAIDEVSGYLYTCGSNGGSATTVIFDLSNPTSPVEVGTWPSNYEHDVQVVTFASGPNAGRQLMFGAGTGAGLDIVDVTNKSNVFHVSTTPYASVAYCHQMWTEDGQHLYINDELDNIPRTTVMDISDVNNPFVAGEFTSGLGAIDHNQYVKNGFLFAANYKSGLRIFDVGSDPVNPTEVGFFDTFPADDGDGFGGAWSCFPYYPSGLVIVSDGDRGLFVLDPTEALVEPLLTFEFPNGLPTMISPSGGSTVIVDVNDNAAQHQSGTGMLHVDDGTGFTAILMTAIDGNTYEATFPPVPCGTTARFYFSAETTDGDAYFDPINAPAGFYSAISASGFEVAFSDNFETDLGWTVQNTNLATGAWTRGVPNGGGSRGDPLADYDGSGQCYVTGNTVEEDVDGGPTRLLSPTFDLSADPNASVAYGRWMSNNNGDDFLVTEVSNNDGASWVQVDAINNTGGWQEHSFVVADYVVPTNQVRLRFSVADQPNNSVTEAAIDAVEISTLVCDTSAILTEVTRTLGIFVSGGVAELLASDDTYYVLQSGPGFDPTEPHPARADFTFDSAGFAASTLDITLEERANIGGPTAVVLLRNRVNSEWDELDRFSLSPADQTFDMTGIPAAEYIGGGGNIKVRVRTFAVLVLDPTIRGIFSHDFVGVRMRE